MVLFHVQAMQLLYRQHRLATSPGYGIVRFTREPIQR